MFCHISFLTLKRWKNQAFQFSNALYHNMRERVSFSIRVRRKLVFSLILIISTTVQWWFSHWFHLLSFQILSSSWWDKWRTITWRSPSISNPEIQHSTVCLYSWNKDCDDEIGLFVDAHSPSLSYCVFFFFVSFLYYRNDISETMVIDTERSSRWFGTMVQCNKVLNQKYYTRWVMLHLWTRLSKM